MSPTSGTVAAPAAAFEAALPVSARSQPADTHRFAQLEGQRGLAAVLVVIFHAYQYDRSRPGGTFPYEGTVVHPLFYGLDGTVSWFFVLSAFLLALPYARAVLDGRPGTPARRFLARRAVRIVPLYLVAVLVVWAWRNPRLPGNWQDLVEHLTFTQVFDQQRIFYTIGPAWSLAVEVQFYVVLAVLGVLATRVGGRLASRAQRLALLWSGTAGLALVTVAWALVMGVGLGHPKQDFVVWFSLPAKLSVFAVGIAVAVFVADRRPALSAGISWGLRLAGCAIVLLAMYRRGPSGADDPLFHSLCGAGFGLLVLSSVAGPQTGLYARVLSSRALVWLGLVSYSLYLWHEPLLLSLAGVHLLPAQSVGAFPVTAGLLLGTGLVVAWVSYWVIEYPASHLRSRDDRPNRRPAPIASTRDWP